MANCLGQPTALLARRSAEGISENSLVFYRTPISAGNPAGTVGRKSAEFPKRACRRVLQTDYKRMSAEIRVVSQRTVPYFCNSADLKPSLLAG